MNQSLHSALHRFPEIYRQVAIDAAADPESIENDYRIDIETALTQAATPFEVRREAWQKSILRYSLVRVLLDDSTLPGRCHISTCVPPREARDHLVHLSGAVLQPAQVLHVSEDGILASVPHPNPRLGRFRWLFPPEELPKDSEGNPQAVKFGDVLILQIHQTGRGRIQGIVITGVEDGLALRDDLPPVEGHGLYDEAGRLGNEATMDEHIAPIIAEARRRQRSQKPEE